MNTSVIYRKHIKLKRKRKLNVNNTGVPIRTLKHSRLQLFSLRKYTINFGRKTVLIFKLTLRPTANWFVGILPYWLARRSYRITSVIYRKHIKRKLNVNNTGVPIRTLKHSWLQLFCLRKYTINFGRKTVFNF